ncbi:MAG: PAS domain-containing protein [Rhodobacteraceae bacterium]|nr:PAS domain-containing protein [Paracoccaceae bacterium]
MVWFTDGTTDGKGRNETGDFHQLQEVRAYWEAMRRAGRLPRRDDINPRGMASALEQVFLVEQIAPNHGRLRLAGMGLSDLLGMDVRGMPITALLEPVARARLSEALGGLFRGEHILDLWLEAERGIGRPPLMARMLVLPLIGSQGEPDLALGCLCTKGTVGRTPRRFTISRMLREPIVGQSQADLAREDLHRAFAEPPRPFHPPKGGSHLRLVVSR